MPEPINPRGKDNHSSYVVEDRSSNPEMIRLMIQDQSVTAGMGGPLTEQPDPAALRHVLDIGCAPGGGFWKPQFVTTSLCALGKAGYLFAQESTGLTRALPRLLTECGGLNVQTKAYTLEYLAGTVGGQHLYHDAMYGFQTLLPFLQKWGCASDDYDAVYQQAMVEIQQRGFRATWDQVITWGAKAESSH